MELNNGIPLFPERKKGVVWGKIFHDHIKLMLMVFQKAVRTDSITERTQNVVVPSGSYKLIGDIFPTVIFGAGIPPA